jgi:hypothetical protein
MKNFRASDPALVIGRNDSSHVTHTAGKGRAIRQLDLNFRAIAGVFVDAKDLNRLTRKIGAFDVVFLHLGTSFDER